MTQFDASASALGFVYQVRWSMYELLLASRRADDQSICITLEVFDDVALTDENLNPLSAIQLKHHEGQGSLTDRSPDLWKTIRVWLQTPSLANANGPMLSLVTTSPVQSGSGVSLLGADPNQRNVARALELLNTVAESGSKATEAGRAAWNEASSSIRSSLLSRMYVVGGSVNVSNLDQLIDAELAPFVPARHIVEYRNRLWGWWDSRCVALLLQNRSGSAGVVIASELYERMQWLRDELRSDALVVDVTLDFNDEEISAGHDERFVEQLKLIKISQSTLRSAVVDYLRAYAHTTKWVQNGDLFDDELQRYEWALKDLSLIHI